MEGAFIRSERYAPRPITWLGVRLCPGGWRLKTYSIRYASAPLDSDLYEQCLSVEAARLPRPAESERSPGVGVAIFHQGRAVHYLVLGWWHNENEFPLRVFVRGFGDAAWRPAGEHESICVWDFQILWFEREAYVRHVLAPEQEPDIDAYLATHLDLPAPLAGSDRC